MDPPIGTSMQYEAFKSLAGMAEDLKGQAREETFQVLDFGAGTSSLGSHITEDSVLNKERARLSRMATSLECECLENHAILRPSDHFRPFRYSE
jgi:hypothetical protein